MTCYQEIHCPNCDSSKIIKSGKNATGTQRYLCQNPECDTHTFMLDYTYKACESGMEVGKQNTQKIERKNLNLRTWIKRLTRKTICFSKSEKMHDIVIGLLINKVEFGRDIHA